MEGQQPITIAIPLPSGEFAMHFRHCERVAIVDVDLAERKSLTREDIDAPPPAGPASPWPAERGATPILAGGMGRRAQDLFVKQGIRIMIGVLSDVPECQVADHPAGTLQSGEHVCER